MKCNKSKIIVSIIVSIGKGKGQGWLKVFQIFWQSEQNY